MCGIVGAEGDGSRLSRPAGNIPSGLTILGSGVSLVVTVLLHSDVRIALLLLLVVSWPFGASAGGRCGVCRPRASWLQCGGGRCICGRCCLARNRRVEDALLEVGYFDVGGGGRLWEFEGAVELGDDVGLGLGVGYFLWLSAYVLNP